MAVAGEALSPLIVVSTTCETNNRMQPKYLARYSRISTRALRADVTHVTHTMHRIVMLVELSNTSKESTL